MATAAEIQQLYIAYFGRPADPTGLAAWRTNPGSLSSIAYSFGTTSEFTSANAGLTTQQSVNALYRNLFGRDAETAGLNAWTLEINAGRLTLAQAGLVIAQGAQGTDLTALNSKVTASGNFTTQTNTSTAGILSYNGRAGIDAGRAFLIPVVSTATIPTSAATTTAVNNLIAAQGGGSALTFNQIAQNAVLTAGANANALGTSNGFTPSANFLTNVSDTIRVGVFSGGVIVDSTVGDNDILVLDQAGFNQTATTVAGVEILGFAGAASFQAGTLAGVTTLNVTNAAEFGNATGAGGSVINQNTTGLFVVSANGGRFSLAQTFNVSGNGGNLGFTAVSSFTSLTINAASSVNFIQVGSFSQINVLNLNASTAATGTLTLSLDNFSAGASAVTQGGSFVYGGNLNIIQSNHSGGQYFTAGSGNVFNFNAVAGSTFYNFGGVIGTAAAGDLLTANFSSFLGLDGIRVLNNESGLSGGLIVSATLNIDTATRIFSLAATQGSGVQSISGGIGLNFVSTTANDSAGRITASTANIVNLSFFTGSSYNTFTADSASISAGGIQTFNLSFFGATAGVSLTNPISDTALDTLNIFGTASKTLTYTNFALVSGFRQVSFDAGLNVLSFQSGVTQIGSGGNNVTFRAIGGVGNDTFDLNYFNTASTVSSFAYVGLSQGGSDTIVLGYSAGSGIRSAINSGNFRRADVFGFGNGDVLSFTAQANGIGVSAVAFVTLANIANTSLSAAGLSAGGIGLAFDGTDTFVFFAGGTTANFGVANNGDTASTLAAILRGVDASNAARWNLNALGQGVYNG